MLTLDKKVMKAQRKWSTLRYSRKFSEADMFCGP